MSFISNASNFTLADGVYNNVHGDIVYNFYSKIRRREEIEGRSLSLCSHSAIGSLFSARWMGFAAVDTPSKETSSIGRGGYNGG
jgi:hypothetical protein